ncbi:MAG: zinc-dependent metalloprotease [Bacteroidota bacterium]
MFKRIIPFASALLLMAGVTQAQQLRPCSTDEHYREMLKEHPELAEYEPQFAAQMGKQAYYKTTAASDTITYDIPVVVHIVHDYGVEFISDNVIYEAVKYWSIVYNKQNPDTATVIAPFVPHIGNPKMRLHLATKDPNGNATKGVVRHFSYLTAAASDQAKYQSWPNNKYINIWFIKAFGAASAGAAAYAYYPSSGATMPHYDGIISLYSYINNAPNKTIPHELGHVLNLAHVWGSTNSPEVACGDDGVWDTPPTKGHTSCFTNDTTCSSGYTHTFVSSSGLPDSLVNYPDTNNLQNIMEYAYCDKMFTNGQATRMRTALTSGTAGRNNLITAANLNATGALLPMPDLPPVADFTMNKAVGGGAIVDPRSHFLTFNNAGSFQFRNASWNDTVSSVEWEFSNSPTTATSTSMTTVNNQFAQTGWVTVKLKATSNAGSNTITNSKAVYVADTAVAGGMGYTQNFSNEAGIANWPMFNYYDNQFKWQFYNGAGVDDNSCVMFRSFDTSNRRTGTATGDFDDIYTPAFNLAGVTGNCYFNFYTSGASTNTGLSGWVTKVNDSLEIQASTSGGARWTKIAGFRGSQVANYGNKVSEYITPDASKWVQRGVNVPATYRTSNTFFRIRYRAGNAGNNMFLDKISISGFPAGVAEAITANTTFNIYPNPATNGCNLVFKTGDNGVVSFSITDVAGRQVFTQSKTYTANSMQQEEISRSVTPAAGMYFVTCTVDGISTTQKLVVF